MGRGGQVYRKATILIIAALLVALTAAAPAGAQTLYYHPNSGNYWYCEPYGAQYWCYAYEMGSWVSAVGDAQMQADGWLPVG